VKISARKESYCNFIDDCTSVLKPNKVIYRYTTPCSVRLEKECLTHVYRLYATLMFVFVIDEAESELAVLDLIQVFVEVLDRSFENVCELDLIFNPDKVSEGLKRHAIAKLHRGRDRGRRDGDRDQHQRDRGGDESHERT